MLQGNENKDGSGLLEMRENEGLVDLWLREHILAYLALKQLS